MPRIIIFLVTLGTLIFSTSCVDHAAKQAVRSRLKLCSDASAARVYSEEFTSGKYSWRQVANLSHEEAKEIVDNFLSTRFDPYATDCIYHVKVEFDTRMGKQTVFLSTDGCDSYYVDGLQGTTGHFKRRGCIHKLFADNRLEGPRESTQ